MFVARMASEQVELLTKDGHCVCISCHWNCSLDLRGYPGHGVQVQNINFVEALFSVVSSEHIELAADARHGVACPCGRLLSTNFRFTPNKTRRVQHIEVIEPRIPVVATVEIDLVTMNRGCVIVSACRRRSECFWFIVGVINIAHIWRLWHG